VKEIAVDLRREAVAEERGLDVKCAVGRVHAGQRRRRNASFAEETESALDGVDGIVERQEVGHVAAGKEERHAPIVNERARGLVPSPRARPSPDRRSAIPRGRDRSGQLGISFRRDSAGRGKSVSLRMKNEERRTQSQNCAFCVLIRSNRFQAMRT
jgi:hypothetical protein